jgi:hypothetical protein
LETFSLQVQSFEWPRQKSGPAREGINRVSPGMNRRFTGNR